MGFRNPRSGQPGVRACCGGREEAPAEQGSHAPTQYKEAWSAFLILKAQGPGLSLTGFTQKLPAPGAAQSPRVLTRRPPPLPTPAAPR